ncbi:Uu.00g136760.m01.CDS01 [Anthostomella pinea]|uniref:Uu.00g136760.m01.CDS01 n=1 Tax=Anthostomella pinea TaxID=933095 RepID=A0AAI8VPC8_9PEZI|nr:Uu.00g136760.m01.CDS01 [Anthostomella pinea]
MNTFVLPSRECWNRRHEYIPTRTGIGFRVVAEDGSKPNYAGLLARYPDGQADDASLIRHLTWRRCYSPWVSVHVDWDAAIRRAEYYRNSRNARSIYIVVVDMEMHSPSINAASFALHYGLQNLNVYQAESLYYGGIDERAIVAIIPATLGFQKCNIHLATVPRDILLSDWSLLDETYIRTGVYDGILEQRVKEAWCWNVNMLAVRRD